MSERFRFGENFNPDATNRLDVLKEHSFPEYVQLSREARNRLKESLEKEGWPELDSEKLSGMEDIFDSAREQVNQRWDKYVSGLVVDQGQDWIKQIEASSAEEEQKVKLIEIFSNPDKLEQAFKKRDIMFLEQLRGVIPEAWRSLVLLSSERQLASLVLLRHWSKENLDSGDLQRIGVNKEEFDFLLDSAGTLGKYIDHAYIKQIELADAPGGSSKTKLGDQVGAENVYDIYKPGGRGISIKTYSEVFPFEWPRIAKRLEGLAKRAENLLKKGKLSEEKYKDLPAYLRQVSQVYGLESVSLDELNTQWEKLYAASRDLALEGCPIMLVPQGCPAVAGDANKVDAEMRFGFITKESEEFEKAMQEFIESAQRINERFPRAVAEQKDVPPVVANYQPFAFGPNLSWFTSGESNRELALIHGNTVVEGARLQEIPLIERITGQLVDEKNYVKHALLDVGIHETSHSIISNEDESVNKRLGQGNNAAIVEEFKAEILGSSMIKEMLEKGELPMDLNEWAMAKLGVICKYLFDGAGERGSFAERYYYAAVGMSHKLLETGAIRITANGKYEITDSKLMVSALGELAEEILKLYTDLQTLPKDVDKRVRKLKKQEKSKEVQLLLEALKDKT